MKDVEVTEKETAQLDCEVSKTHISKTGEVLPVVWFKKLDEDGVEKEEKVYSGGRIEMVKLNRKLVLKINNATVEDSGTYVVSVGGVKAQAKLTVNEIPVVFKKPLEDQRAKEGQSSSFECTVNRADKPVTWFVNGKPITKEDITSGKYSVSQEKNRLQLTINNLDLARDNNCEITCQVGDKAKSVARLKVDEDDIKFVERLADNGVKENEPAQFVCKLSKTKYETRPNQDLKIRWFIKGKELDEKVLGAENSRYSVEQIDTVLKLNISSVHAEDAGEVKCEVNGSIHTAASLAVEEEPVVFVKKLADQTCEEIPGKVKFECELNKSFVNAKWYRNGKEITLDDTKFDFGREGPKHFLIINDVDGKDEGEYTIVLQGKFEKKCMAKLAVKAPPKLHLNAKYKDTVTLKRGQPLILEVSFSGSPEPKASWLLEDEPIKDSSRAKIETVRNNLTTLVMNKTQRSDSGKYNLVLENEYGREKCTIKVNVLDKPAPPRNPKVNDVTASEMRVSWDAPQDDGGSPITGYVIEVRDYNRKSWNELETVTHFELSYLAANLIEGTRYSFRISAENKYGRSDPAEIKEPVEAKHPFSPPDAPLNCQAKDVTKSSCSITFEPPAFDGGSPITGYVIERRQASTSRWLRFTREPIQTLSYKCSDLIEGYEYEFRAIAENKAGLGAPSEPCKPFTAKDPFDRPGPPINLKVGEVTKSTIELNWEPPLSDGGSPITGYVIERRNPKTMKWQALDLGRIAHPYFIITDLKENHEYEFRVLAVNAAGEGEPSASTPLIVAKTKIIGDKPTLLEPMKDQRVMVGERAHFVARIKAKPPPEIKWALNERNLTSKDDCVSTYDNNSVELTINNVQVKDEGVYKVTVSNPLGEMSTDAKLTVLKKPAIKYDSRLDKTFDVVAIQQNLHISCEISGLPKPEVKWYKDKKEIVLGGDASRAITEFGETVATLHIGKIKRTEGGEFTITAENEVGKAEANFIIRVLDVPMPPENLTVAEISSYSCRLTWSPPKDDGNVPIIGYYIEKLDPKRGSYIRLDKTSLTEHYIDKLQKGQNYQFRIIAENRIGLSEPCEMKEPVLAKGKFDLPGAPGIPEISNVTKSSCRVSWEAPRKDGGTPILGYFVEKRSGTKWFRVNKDLITGTHLDLKDLAEGSDYEFRVCAVNEEGEGPFSKGSDSITAKNPFDKPDPPIDVEVQNITKTSCLLNWRPPKKTGGQPIIRYHVEMRTKGEYKFFRFTDDFISECEYEVRDLIENQEYEFRIVAENKQGESLPSDPTRTFKARDNIPGIQPEIEPIPDCGNLIGSQGKISARVTGTPTPNIKWKRGPRLLKLDSSKYSITFAEGVAVLLIKELNEEDAGTYTIEAENSAGFDSKSCKYSVFEPPRIDYDKKYKKMSAVSVGSNFRIACQVTGCPKAEVTWYRDDSKIKRGDKAVCDNPVDTQHYITIKQCDRGDSGVYIIKASNEHGKAEARFEVQIVDVPDQPRGPLDVTLETGFARSATLSWKAPRWDGGSELVQYVIEYAKILEPSISKSKFLMLNSSK